MAFAKCLNHSKLRCLRPQGRASWGSKLAPLLDYLVWGDFLSCYLLSINYLQACRLSVVRLDASFG